jgi:hypothetical protein
LRYFRRGQCNGGRVQFTDHGGSNGYPGSADRDPGPTNGYGCASDGYRRTDRDGRTDGCTDGHGGSADGYSCRAADRDPYRGPDADPGQGDHSA